MNGLLFYKLRRKLDVILYDDHDKQNDIKPISFRATDMHTYAKSIHSMIQEMVNIQQFFVTHEQ